MWHVIKGDLDAESINLIKEATGHKADNVVDLTEFAVAASSAKAVSKTTSKAFSEASSKLKDALSKARKVGTANSETKLARQIWGYEPYTIWENRKLNPPIAIKTGLIVEEDIESGDARRILEAEGLKSYFDPSNGWVCIGELSTFEDKEVIEFARNTIVVLKDGEIVSLWLKPIFE